MGIYQKKMPNSEITTTQTGLDTENSEHLTEQIISTIQYHVTNSN